MKTVRNILIYLVGCFLAYLIFRHDMKHDTGKYTTSDRAVCLLLSAGSWISVGSGLLVYEAGKLHEYNETPANW